MCYHCGNFSSDLFCCCCCCCRPAPGVCFDVGVHHVQGPPQPLLEGIWEVQLCVDNHGTHGGRPVGKEMSAKVLFVTVQI